MISHLPTNAHSVSPLRSSADIETSLNRHHSGPWYMYPSALAISPAGPRPEEGFSWYHCDQRGPPKRRRPSLNQTKQGALSSLSAWEHSLVWQATHARVPLTCQRLGNEVKRQRRWIVTAKLPVQTALSLASILCNRQIYVKLTNEHAGCQKSASSRPCPTLRRKTIPFSRGKRARRTDASKIRENHPQS
jgi:hypothetical protein